MTSGAGPDEREADAAIRLLYVDGDADRRTAFGDELAAVDDRFAVETVDRVSTATDRVADGAVDGVVTAAELADGDPLALVEELRSADLAVPVVFFVENGSERLAAAAVSRDVADYVRRDAVADPYDRLAESIRDAVDGGGEGDARGGDAVRADAGGGDADAADADGERTAVEAVATGADVGLLACRPDGTVAFANEACGSVLRTDVGDLVGEPLGDTPLVDAGGDLPDSESRTWEVRLSGEGGERVSDGGASDAALLAEEVDDNPQRTVEVTARPVAAGGERFVVCTCADVTDRVRYERDSNILDAVFESIPVYLYIKDEDARHVRVSAVNEEAQDYIGKTDVEIWGEDGRETYEEDLRVIEEGEEIYQKEEYNLDWNHFYITSKVPWRAEDGEIRGLIGITEDLSDWKQKEKQLERQNERLRTVASVISHDIRNPLQVAKGRIDLASDRHDSDNIDAATDALDRMGSLLEELLDLVRHGQWVEDPETVSLQSLAEGCWETATGDAGHLDVEMDVTLEADPGRLQQLLENLFRNAVVHGGDDVTVRVGPMDSWAGFYVEDDGPGIPEDERDEVFESGYTTSEEGTGFGLAIVQVIAEAHGWNVRLVESEAGGARFEFPGVEWV